MGKWYFDHVCDRPSLHSLGFTQVTFLDDQRIQDGDLVIVHSADATQSARVAGSKGPIRYVFASRVPSELANALSATTLAPNCGILRYPVDELQDNQRFCEFVRCWDAGDYRADLLGPSRVPETLVAAYLLMVALEKGCRLTLEVLQSVAPQDGSEFWKRAREELIELIGSGDVLPNAWADLLEADCASSDWKTRVATIRSALESG